MDMRGNIFITYRDIIKTPDIALLKALKDDCLKEQFKDIIDYTKFEFMNDPNLMRLILQRTDMNIFRYLGKIPNYDYDKLYDLIYSTVNSKYVEYRSLFLVKPIINIVSNQFINKIYFYTEKYEEDVRIDIGKTFTNNVEKIEYVYGNIHDVLSIRDVDLYIINDIMIINKLIASHKIFNKEVLLPIYGYNYTIEEGNLVLKIDPDMLLKRYNVTMRLYRPFELTSENMTQYYNNVDPDSNLSRG